MNKQWLEDCDVLLHQERLEQAERDCRKTVDLRCRESEMQQDEWYTNRVRQIQHSRMHRYSREYFMQSEGYFLYDPMGKISSAELYRLYCLWCSDQRIAPQPKRALLVHVKENEERYHLLRSCNIPKPGGGHVRGFLGIRSLKEAGKPHP